MTNPYESKILIIMLPLGDEEYIDSENDAVYPNAGRVVFSWRREGQEIPSDACILLELAAKTVYSSDKKRQAETLMHAQGIHLSNLSEAIKVIEKLHQSIRRAIPTGIGWGYTHGRAHAQLVEHNEKEKERMESGELSSWEQELLVAS